MTILEHSKSPDRSNNKSPEFRPLSHSGSDSVNLTMISSAADRYITPEYLVPLPPTSGEKLGKSPLQLLAQTCSQIGADSGSNKLLSDKSSTGGSDQSSHQKSSKNGRSPTLVVTDPKPVSFKPYESQKSDKSKSSVVSLSPTGSLHSQYSGTSCSSPKANGKSPSPTTITLTSPATKERSSSATSAASLAKSSATSSSSSSGATPVIRSGLEVLAGQHLHSGKDFNSLRFPAAEGIGSNPAFRPPFGGLPGYPPIASSSAVAAAAPSSSVCRDPYCRDPTCPTAIYNVQLAAALSGVPGLPAGYVELLQTQKLGLSGVPGTSLTSASTTSASSSPITSTSAVITGPYICNWMNGRDGYCGKRHSSAEDLLQHLRTHTNLSTNDSAASLLSSSLYPQAGLFSGAGGSSAATAVAFHRSYTSSAALTGLSAPTNRFHPYNKPTGLGSTLPPTLGLGALGMPPALPPSFAGLGGAYSPAASIYASLYGSR